MKLNERARWAILLAAVTAMTVGIFGCGARDPERGEIQMKTPVDGRVRVERIATFRDTIAYNRERGVYVITDTKTGKEFVGISGIGIAETGSHQSGKTTSTDER